MKEQWFETPAGIMKLKRIPTINPGFGFFGDNEIRFNWDECTPITPANLHAPQMLEFAQDAFKHEKPEELWECRDPGDEWASFSDGDVPEWLAYLEYRRKPDTVTIHGVEVPDDFVTEPLETGQEYYVVDLSDKRLFRVVFYIYTDEIYKRMIERQLAHHTEEGVVAHAKAMLKWPTTG